MQFLLIIVVFINVLTASGLKHDKYHPELGRSKQIVEEMSNYTKNG